MLKCIKCDFLIEIEYSKTRILSSINTARCEYCLDRWTDEFIKKSFGSEFCVAYKAHQKKLSIERRKSKNATRILNKHSYDLLDDMKNQIGKIRAEMNTLHSIRSELSDRLLDLRDNKPCKILRDKFFGHCPASNCKGFVDETYCCGICGKKICKSCKESISEKQPEKQSDGHPNGQPDDSHECDPNTLETLKEMKQTTQNCPKCKVSIFKTEGCNQMFCVNCNISFCWRTGEIYTKNIHNPHYFEWINRSGNVAINTCNDEIPDSINGIKMYLDHNISTDIINIFRFVRHIKFVEIARYEKLIGIDNELEYRIDYITNVIDEDIFKRKLQICDKRKQKYRDMCQIFDTFVNISVGYIYQYLFIVNNELRYEQITKKNACEFIRLFNDLIEYINESMTHIKSKYKNECPFIHVQEIPFDGYVIKIYSLSNNNLTK